MGPALLQSSGFCADSSARMLCLPALPSHSHIIPPPWACRLSPVQCEQWIKETPSFSCSTHFCVPRSDFSGVPSPVVQSNKHIPSLNSHTTPELLKGLQASHILIHKNLHSGYHSKERQGKKGKGMTSFSCVNIPLRKQFFAKTKALRSVKLTQASKYLLVPHTDAQPRLEALGSLCLLFSKRLITADLRGREGRFPISKHHTFWFPSHGFIYIPHFVAMQGFLKKCWTEQVPTVMGDYQ